MSVRQTVFRNLYRIIESYGFQRYDGPTLEAAETYEAKSGHDIADLQLYTLTDKSGRRLAIRPEMTPSVARIVARYAGSLEFPLRWYSHPNCMRYERSQRGRVREHWQINCDIFGSESEQCEIEILELVHDLLASLGSGRDDYVVRLNCRIIAESALRNIVGVRQDVVPSVFAVMDRWEKIDESDRLRDLAECGLTDTQSQRLLTLLASGPDFVGMLPAADLEASNVAKLLRAGDDGLFRIDPLIIRALEYYTSTVFEVFDTHPANRRSLFGGGRYAYLAGLFTARSIPGIGFGMGDVTLLDVLETHSILPRPEPGCDAVVVPVEHAHLGGEARKVARMLRRAGIRTTRPLDPRSLSAELKRAAREGCRVAVIIGTKELQEDSAAVRDMGTGERVQVGTGELAEYVGTLLGRAHV